MNRLLGFVLTVLLSLPSVVWAQSDPAALEAYINDHKQVRSLLLARSTLELSNQLLHDYSKKAAVEYKDFKFRKFTLPVLICKYHIYDSSLQTC